MLPEPGHYPSPFPKVPEVVAPVHPEAIVPSFPDQDVGQLVCLLCVYHKYDKNVFYRNMLYSTCDI